MVWLLCPFLVVVVVYVCVSLCCLRALRLRWLQFVVIDFVVIALQPGRYVTLIAFGFVTLVSPVWLVIGLVALVGVGCFALPLRVDYVAFGLRYVCVTLIITAR